MHWASGELSLTLLPFPGQWRHLNASKPAAKKDAEVLDFLGHEKTKVAEKFWKKTEEPGTFATFYRCSNVLKAPVKRACIASFSLPRLLPHTLDSWT
ncbi:hypothetical protein EDC27_1054 [Desulfosoma caldarium]|uniref:Uncharacterized protein n=1 Tax=Desulfosoma caldarium TaxID=610254 RepID=A0A3N1VLL6_9BACT|nr:hypothetical protein EDC27_1054 [Desulfosoma caldarium]